MVRHHQRRSFFSSLTALNLNDCSINALVHFLCDDQLTICGKSNCTQRPKSCDGPIARRSWEVTTDESAVCPLSADEAKLLHDGIQSTIENVESDKLNFITSENELKTIISKLPLLRQVVYKETNPVNEECSEWDWYKNESKQHHQIHDTQLNDNGSPTLRSCNPEDPSYAATGSTTLKYNALPFLSMVFTLYVCLVFFAASNTKTTGALLLRFNLHYVRVGCCLVLAFMALLMYLCAMHLLQASVENGMSTWRSQDAHNEGMWSALYLCVSFMCFKGGLALLPNLAMQHHKPKVHLDTLLEQQCCGMRSILPISCEETRKRGDARERMTCCHKVSQVMFRLGFVFYTEFWDCRGRYFWMKLALLEVVEVLVQIVSLQESTARTDAGDVITTSLIIGLNCIIVPMVAVVYPKVYSVSSRSVLSLIIVAEVFFDKLLVAMIVFTRYDSIFKSGSSFMEQVACHLGILVPALLTFLDINDALDILGTNSKPKNVQRHSMKCLKNMQAPSAISTCKDATIGQQSVVSGRPRKAPGKVLITRSLYLCAATSIFFGVGLIWSVLYSYAQQVASCTERIGPLASCAYPRIYFQNGLFGTTGCGFEYIEAFSCSRLSGFGRLPDAETEYELMSRLSVIDLSKSKDLERVPSGWSKIPVGPESDGLIIDVSNSREFHGLPFSLCSSSNTKLKEIRFGGTRAAQKLNWSRQIFLHNNQSGAFTIKSINRACKNALLHDDALNITELSLSHNNLSDTDVGKDSSIHLFLSVLKLDLSFNRITFLNISRQDGSTFHDILFGKIASRIYSHAIGTSDSTFSSGGAIRRILLSDVEKSTYGINFSNNPLDTVAFAYLPSEEVSLWFSVVTWPKKIGTFAFSRCSIDSFQSGMFMKGTFTHLNRVIFVDDKADWIDKSISEEEYFYRTRPEEWGIPGNTRVCACQPWMNFQSTLDRFMCNEAAYRCRVANVCRIGSLDYLNINSECRCGDDDCAGNEHKYCYGDGSSNPQPLFCGKTPGSVATFGYILPLFGLGQMDYMSRESLSGKWCYDLPKGSYVATRNECLNAASAVVPQNIPLERDKGMNKEELDDWSFPPGCLLDEPIAWKRRKKKNRGGKQIIRFNEVETHLGQPCGENGQSCVCKAAALPCPFTNGSISNEMPGMSMCACGQSICSTNGYARGSGMVCLLQGKDDHGVCMRPDYTPCTYTQGSRPNTVSCRCDLSDCESNETTGMYCFKQPSARMKCAKFPPCLHVNGLFENTRACVCGAAVCQTAQTTGMFCTRKHNICHQEKGTLFEGFRELKKGKCEDLPFGRVVVGLDLCGMAASLLYGYDFSSHKLSITRRSRPQLSPQCAKAYVVGSSPHLSSPWKIAFNSISTALGQCTEENTCICAMLTPTRCLYEDGQTPNSEECVCGKIICSAPQLHCYKDSNDATNDNAVCTSSKQCIHRGGHHRNTGSCMCGKMRCSTQSPKCLAPLATPHGQCSEAETPLWTGYFRKSSGRCEDAIAGTESSRIITDAEECVHAAKIGGYYKQFVIGKTTGTKFPAGCLKIPKLLQLEIPSVNFTHRLNCSETNACFCKASTSHICTYNKGRYSNDGVQSCVCGSALCSRGSSSTQDKKLFCNAAKSLCSYEATKD